MSLLRGLRGLATKAAPAAAAAAEVALPLKLFGLAGRYASALYVAAAKTSSLKVVEQELVTVAALARSSDRFAAFLTDPSGSKTDKLKGVTAVMDAGKFSDTTKRFFSVVAENGRLGETAAIVEQFEALMMAARGEVKAVVTSAEPLTPEELASAKAALEKLLAKGETLNLSAAVNPAILGGLVVDIGDKHLDLSLNTRIRKVEALLAEAV